MRETLNQLDTDLFLWLNGTNAPWFDTLMIWVTERNHWFPFYAVLVFWLIYRFHKLAIGLILTIVAAVALSDQLSSSLFKPWIHRLRPCHTPGVQEKIHHILGCGGPFGFVSSHAATTFALATILWLLLGNRYLWLRWTFLWAAVVTYSRIYVGVHYPLDVLAGTGIGVFSGWICMRLYHRVPSRFQIASPEMI